MFRNNRSHANVRGLDLNIQCSTYTALYYIFYRVIHLALAQMQTKKVGVRIHVFWTALGISFSFNKSINSNNVFFYFFHYR